MTLLKISRGWDEASEKASISAPAAGCAPIFAVPSTRAQAGAVIGGAGPCLRRRREVAGASRGVMTRAWGGWVPRGCAVGGGAGRCGVFQRSEWRGRVVLSGAGRRQAGVVRPGQKLARMTRKLSAG